MAILTEQDLRNTSIRLSDVLRKAYLNRKNILNEAKRTGKVTVFLSHSHEDASYIEMAVLLLSNLGVEVYVDWKDPSMPAITNSETALRIKDKIKENKKFVLLASPNAIRSNWVNWELGFGDSLKYINEIALMPFVKTSDRNWSNAEYLRIYPHIETEQYMINYSLQDVHVVKYPNGTSKYLAQWLNS